MDKEMMVVSGRVYFDGLGRTTKAHYPISEQTGKESLFTHEQDKVEPTVSTFDVLDRTLTVTLPDKSITRTEYGFSTDRKGVQ